jgi:Type IV secretion system pilin
MNKFKLILTAIYAFALSLTPGVAMLSLAGTAHAATDIQNSLCNGSNLSAPGSSNSGNCTDTTNGSGVNNIVNTVITVFSWVVGVVSVIMIIVGGFKYVTSGGESSGVTSAKNTILYAIVGLIIVAISQVIVKFVLSNVTKQ